MPKLAPYLLSVCLLVAPAARAAVVYDFETVPLGSTLPITFPDGTVIDGETGSPFHVVNFNLLRITGHALRDDLPLNQNHGLRIRFPQTYNAVSLDFALNALQAGPWLSMYVAIGNQLTGAAHSQGSMLAGGMFPEGELLFEGSTFDTIFLTACTSQQGFGCQFPPGGTPVSFAIDNVKPWVIPEPATVWLALGGLLILISKRTSART